MTDPIIERAARALFRDDPGGWSGAVEEGLADGAWREYVDSVKIVLRAIRDPSDAMVRAGNDWNMHCGDADTTWQTMIDTALGKE